MPNPILRDIYSVCTIQSFLFKNSMGDPYVQPALIVTLIKVFFIVKELEKLKMKRTLIVSNSFTFLLIAIHHCLHHIEKGMYIQIDADYDSIMYK